VQIGGIYIAVGQYGISGKARESRHDARFARPSFSAYNDYFLHRSSRL
jgi:hypothetical protein